jgi:undecaprenyl-phosphate 4-deoxy-4-formamido-L-arabinose transferase
MAEVMAQKPDIDYEIICVNDASPDGVLAVLKRLALTNDRLTVVDLTRNMGKHAAVMAGYSLVSGDIIVGIDDDGQCPLPELWRLLEPLNNETDAVFAKYPEKKNYNFIRSFGHKINIKMTEYLLGKPKNIYLNNFGAIKRFAIDEILRYQNPYPYIDGLIYRTTYRIANVEMKERGRIGGRSNFTLTKSLKLWLNGFTAFSVKPLRISTVLGLIVALAGFITGLWLIIRRLFITPEMPMGYASTVSINLFIGGMIMCMLGMLGEYVGRIYISINKSPQYVIREIYKGEKES